MDKTKTHEEQADEYVEMFRTELGTFGFDNFKQVATKQALIHVEGLISELLNCMIPSEQRYNTLTSIKAVLEQRINQQTTK